MWGTQLTNWLSVQSWGAGIETALCKEVTNELLTGLPRRLYVERYPHPPESSHSSSQCSRLFYSVLSAHAIQRSCASTTEQQTDEIIPNRLLEGNSHCFEKLHFRGVKVGLTANPSCKTIARRSPLLLPIDKERHFQLLSKSSEEASQRPR